MKLGFQIAIFSVLILALASSTVFIMRSSGFFLKMTGGSIIETKATCINPGGYNCTDFDGGLDYYTASHLLIYDPNGNTIDGMSDHCAPYLGQNYLLESYCDVNCSKKEFSFECPDGCVDNACADFSFLIPCTDANEFCYTQLVSNSTLSQTSNKSNWCKVMNGSSYSCYSCNEGYTWNGSMCVLFGPNCLDLDSGKNYILKGECTDSYGTYSDLCEGGFLIEYYCNEETNYCEYENYNCQNNMCNEDQTACFYNVSENNLLCGNDIAEENEYCDGVDLRNFNCASLGYDHGTLSCTSECVFNESLCEYSSEEDGHSKENNQQDNSQQSENNLGGSSFGSKSSKSKTGKSDKSILKTAFFVVLVLILFIVFGSIRKKRKKKKEEKMRSKFFYDTFGSPFSGRPPFYPQPYQQQMMQQPYQQQQLQFPQQSQMQTQQQIPEQTQQQIGEGNQQQSQEQQNSQQQSQRKNQPQSSQQSQEQETQQQQEQKRTQSIEELKKKYPFLNK